MKLILAILLFIVTFFAFAYLADVVVIDKNHAIDQYLQTFVEAHPSSMGIRFFERITFFGSHYFLIPAYLLLIGLYLYKKRKQVAVNILAIGLTSTGILFLLKDIFKRHRPDNPLISAVTGFSFPSGHSFSSFTFYGVVIYLIWSGQWRKWKKIASTILLIFFAIAIAYSRVYLRVHFPSDVIAGFLLSIIWLLISFGLITRINLRHRKEQAL